MFKNVRTIMVSNLNRTCCNIDTICHFQPHVNPSSSKQRKNKIMHKSIRRSRHFCHYQLGSTVTIIARSIPMTTSITNSRGTKKVFKSEKEADSVNRLLSYRLKLLAQRTHQRTPFAFKPSEQGTHQRAPLIFKP